IVRSIMNINPASGTIDYLNVPKVAIGPRGSVHIGGDEAIEERIAAMRLEMFTAAEGLDFEKAARLRDELKRFQATAGVEANGPDGAPPAFDPYAATKKGKRGRGTVKAKAAPARNGGRKFKARLSSSLDLLGAGDRRGIGARDGDAAGVGLVAERDPGERIGGEKIQLRVGGVAPIDAVGGALSDRRVGHELRCGLAEDADRGVRVRRGHPGEGARSGAARTRPSRVRDGGKVDPVGGVRDPAEREAEPVARRGRGLVGGEDDGRGRRARRDELAVRGVGAREVLDVEDASLLEAHR